MGKTILHTMCGGVICFCLIAVAGSANPVENLPTTPPPLNGAAILKGEPGSGTSNTLVIEFPDFDCRAGSVMIAVYSESNGFLSEQAFVERAVKCSELADNKVELNLPPGRIAVAVYHDSNGNKKLDRNLVSYPTEPFGFSNNPRCITGPPKFDQAAFNLASDMEIRIVLK